MLRLHYHPASTYARRVRIALLEKNIPHELIALDMHARQHRGPEYLALNPYGRVPTLEEDGHVLYESAAILQYLEATRPTPALVPPDVRGRSLVDMHLRLCDQQMAQNAGTILFPKRFLPRERWDTAAMEVARRNLGKHIAILDAQLGKNEYLVANRFTLAEVAYAPFLYFLSLLEVAASPAVAAWSERILARPSAQQTIPPV